MTARRHRVARATAHRMRAAGIDPETIRPSAYLVPDDVTARPPAGPRTYSALTLDDQGTDMTTTDEPPIEIETDPTPVADVPVKRRRRRDPTAPRPQLRAEIDVRLHRAKNSLAHYARHGIPNLLVALLWAPRGAVRGVRWWYELTFPAEPRAARKAATADKNWVERRRCKAEARHAAYFGLTLVVVGFLVVSAAVSRAGLGVHVIVLAYIGAVWLGRPDDVVERLAAPLAPEWERPNDESIHAALIAAKLAKSDKAGGSDAYVVPPGPVAQDDGWVVAVDLGAGKTHGDAQKARAALAGGFGVPASRLFITWPDGASERRVHFYAARHDPLDTGSVLPPYADCKPRRLTDGVDIGRDERGNLIGKRTLYKAELVVGAPQRGKTGYIRHWVATAALDVVTRLSLWDLKGGADLDSYESVADWFGLGADDLVLGQLHEHLTWLHDVEIPRRFKVVRSAPRDLLDDSRLSPRALYDPELNVPPFLLAIDEFHRAVNTAEAGSIGTDIGKLLVQLAKWAPATGLVMLLSTQRAGDGDIPLPLRDVVTGRSCLWVPTSGNSAMALGDGARSAGFDASRDDREGVVTMTGGLIGTPAQFVTLRAFRAELEVHDRVAAAARDLRAAAGTLRGVAAGERSAAVDDDILDHALAALRGADKLDSERLVERLRAEHPARYGPDYSVDDLRGALRRLGVSTSTLVPFDDAEGVRRVWRGPSAEGLRAAIASRRPPSDAL